MIARYPVEGLLVFARKALEKAGLEKEKADMVAEVLMEGDLLGHTTHGLQLLGPYIKEIMAGKMTKSGVPEVMKDSGAAVLWDGRYLPGPWLVVKAIELGFERLREHPTFTASIRNSHHIACLASYLKRATDKGYVILLLTSDPADRGVAPFGGRTPLYTPNPIAAGWPTNGDPVLLDVSMSNTTIGLCMRRSKQGKRLPGKWVMDHLGRLNDDPAVIFSDPPGSILPLGGVDVGHKGFALGLLVETLTSALCGSGRAEAPKRWTASVFVQLIDPAAFGGLEQFKGETSWLVESCRNSDPIDPDNPVRVPGQAALEHRSRAIAEGVELAEPVVPMLKEWAEKLDVQFPETVSEKTS